MTPNLKGLSGALTKMKTDLDTQAAALISDIESAGARGSAALKKARGVVSDALASVKEVEDFAASLEGSNGGPPLGGSSSSSAAAAAASNASSAAVETAAKPQPAGSWAGAKAP